MAADERRWRALWDGYLKFYETAVADSVTEFTWKRILEPASPVYGIVAERRGRGVVGIANYVIHENTWTLMPVCYLEDLFVDPEVRGGGVGRLLIDWLVREMSERNWSRLYWHTRETNYRARALYDSFVPHSGFVRYVIPQKA